MCKCTLSDWNGAEEALRETLARNKKDLAARFTPETGDPWISTERDGGIKTAAAIQKSCKTLQRVRHFRRCNYA